MPALWPSMVASLKAQLPTASDVDSLANIYASTYSNAISSSSIVISSSTLTSAPQSSLIEQGFKSTFNILSRINEELAPNYKDEEIPEDEFQKQQDSRQKIESAFLLTATQIILAWTSAQFNSAIPMPGYVAPTSGYAILFPGDPSSLSKDLAKAFFIAQSETDSNSAFLAHTNGLIEAYSKHLLSITGIYNGLVPAVPSPIPGPPISWVGIS